jgi:dihydroorotate dehydrogenase (fumarate)
VNSAGAEGLEMFNSFYQTDLDIESRDDVPRIDLSEPWELRLPLRWIAILRPVLGPLVSLAATSGIHSGEDVVKALLVGADVAMTTSALLRHGPEHLAALESGLRAWMAEHEYASVSELRGSVSYATSDNPAAFERANYLRTLHSWTTPATS